MRKYCFFWFIPLFIAALAVTGCASTAAPTPTPIPGEETAAEFLPLYSKIAQVFPEGLGAAKTPAQSIGGATRQIFEKGVMVYNPGTGEAALQPVGYQQVQRETPAEQPAGSSWQQIQGYWAPPAIVQAYNRLGADIIGAPLSNYRYNPTYKRYEMYFENLGLYMLENDPLEQVRLLPYGTWVLANESLPESESNSALSQAIIQNSTEAFDALAARTDEALTGKLIAPLLVSPDGRILRVYTNAVMVWDEATQRAQWLHLPELMGIQPDPLVEQLQNIEMSFVPIEGKLGHNVPNRFWQDFLEKYGSLDAAGMPITELSDKPGSANTIWWQCYEHICLEYNRETGEIAPTPLGEQYYHRYYEDARPQNSSPPLSRIDIETQPALSPIPATTPQQIWVRLQTQGQPLSNATPTLILHLPAGQVEFSFPPTNAQGESILTLPPLAESNGTQVQYDVCLPRQSGEALCATGQFTLLDAQP